jgi:hypothetical protein
MRLARAAEREALPFSSTQVRLSWFLPWHAGNAEISSFQFQKRKKEEEKKKRGFTLHVHVAKTGKRYIQIATSR